MSKDVLLCYLTENTRFLSTASCRSIVDKYHRATFDFLLFDTVVFLFSAVEVEFDSF